MIPEPIREELLEEIRKRVESSTREIDEAVLEVIESRIEHVAYDGDVIVKEGDKLFRFTRQEDKEPKGEYAGGAF